jgi:hypothetical protein
MGCCFFQFFSCVYLLHLLILLILLSFCVVLRSLFTVLLKQFFIPTINKVRMLLDIYKNFILFCFVWYVFTDRRWQREETRFDGNGKAVDRKPGDENGGTHVLVGRCHQRANGAAWTR